MLQINLIFSKLNIFLRVFVVNNLKSGMNIALVSDAGFPCISDPGFLISKYVIENDYNVISLPGASASLTALIASGLPNEKFYFNGFLNSKQSQRIKQLNDLVNKEETLIIYEAPHRIIETLQDIYNVFGNRNIVIARELTKKYEEYIRGSLEDIINNITELKGEIVLIIEGCKETKEVLDLNKLTIKEHFDFYKNKNMSDNDAMKQVAKDRNVSKNVIYKEIKCKNLNEEQVDFITINAEQISYSKPDGKYHATTKGFWKIGTYLVFNTITGTKKIYSNNITDLDFIYNSQPEITIYDFYSDVKLIDGKSFTISNKKAIEKGYTYTGDVSKLANFNDYRAEFSSEAYNKIRTIFG